MTNHTTRRHQELLLPVGMGADGKPFQIVWGYLLETDWGEGKKSYDVEVITSHLQPVIFQQVLKAGAGATVVCAKKDFAKRYKSDAPVKAPTEQGEAVPGNDPDQGHE